MRRTSLLAGLVCLCSAAVAWGQRDADTARLYEAAKKEGKIVIYEQTSPEPSEALQREFLRKYPGIQIERTFARGSQLREKVMAEARAGRQVADTMDTGLDSLGDLSQAGLLSSFQASGMAYVYPEVAEAGALYDVNVVRINLYAVSLNSERISPSEEPKSWSDLTQPKWQGKIAMQDPRPGTGNGLTWFSTFWNEPGFGEAFIRKIAEQKIFFSQSNGPIVSALSRGEHFIGLTPSNGDIYAARKKGAPVKFVMPKEGVYVTPIAIGLIKGAPHPNAAKLWIEFLLSKEGQAIFAEQGYTPSRKDVPGRTQESNLKGIRIMPLQSKEKARNRPFYVQKATEIFFK